MINLTLRQLRFVEALARHGHFGRASQECAVTQPALSMQIKALEEALGAPLFERGRREARLTAFGEQVMTRARAILRAVDELGDFARARRGAFAGRLRLGVIPTVAPYLLPRLLGDLEQAFPGLETSVREAVTPRLMEDLGEGRLEAAILALPAGDPSLVEASLYEEAFALIRPLGEAGRPAPSPERLKEMRLLLLDEGHCFRDQAIAFCGLATGARREALDAASFTTLAQLVAAGHGVTLIPEMAVAVETRLAGVAATRFPAPEPRRRIGMVWRRTSPYGADLEAAAQTARGAARALLPGSEAPEPLPPRVGLD